VPKSCIKHIILKICFGSVSFSLILDICNNAVIEADSRRSVCEKLDSKVGDSDRESLYQSRKSKIATCSWIPVLFQVANCLNIAYIIF